MIDWFKRRGISERTIRAFQITRTNSWFGDGEEPCYAFPYHKDNTLVNVKYRSKDKKFRQESGAERTLFNIDSVKQHWAHTKRKEVIIVEGEMDVLSMWEAGFIYAVTLPDGAPKTAKFDEHDKRFQALQNCEWLHEAEKVIIAVDADEAGQALKLELIHRFGKDRCWTIEYPNNNDIQCKDANECLVEHGADVLREIIELAAPHPIDGLYTVRDYEKEVFNIYDGNVQKALSTGFKTLDAIYKVMPATFAVVTGVPNHGKSNFIDQLAVNLAKDSGWKFAIFSPEHSTANHIRRLSEKVIAKPFDVGPSHRMSKEELTEAMLFLDDRFHFIEAEESIPSIDWLLAKARAACLRHGVKGIIIDPYNEIDATRDGNKREDEHIRDLISRCKQFCRTHEVAMWMVAHPAKMQRTQEGIIPPPSLYDVSGSAHWNNMADVGLVIHRDFETDETRVITRKIREQGLYGNIGECFFKYNLAKHVYEEVDNQVVQNYWTDSD
jgi:twinkle protein